MVNLIGDLRKAWNNPKLAISIPVSGFGGWSQKNSRRLGIIDAQFGACNATRHPGMTHCVAEETRDYWRLFENSPVNQGYQCVFRISSKATIPEHCIVLFLQIDSFVLDAPVFVWGHCIRIVFGFCSGCVRVFVFATILFRSVVDVVGAVCKLFIFN